MKNSLSFFLCLLLNQAIYSAEPSDKVRFGSQLLFSSAKDKDTIFAAALSPDELLMVTAGKDRTAKVWNIDTGECLQVLKGDYDWVRSAVFSPNGQQIGTLSDKTVRIWDTPTGKCLQSLPQPSAAISVFFNFDGSIITVYVDGSVRRWENEKSKLINILKYVDTVASAAFDEKKQVIALGMKSGDVIIKSSKNESISENTLVGHTNEVSSIAFNHDRSLLLTSSLDNNTRIWNTQTGECLKAFENHKSRVASSFFGFKGTKIITTSFDGIVKLWDIETGVLLYALRLSRESDGRETLSPDIPYKSGHVIFPIIMRAICDSSKRENLITIITSDNRAQMWAVNYKPPVDLLVALCSKKFLEVMNDQKPLIDDEITLLGELIKTENAIDFSIKLEWLLKSLTERLTKEVFTQHVTQVLEKSNLDKMRILFENLNNLSVQLPKENLWMLWNKVCQEQEFDIDKVQFLLRQLEYQGEKIPEEVNRIMIENTPEEKLFPLKQ